MLYKGNQFERISSETLETLKYTYNLVVLDYFQKALKEPSQSASQESGTGKRNVIDVDATES